MFLSFQTSGKNFFGLLIIAQLACHDVLDCAYERLCW